MQILAAAGLIITVLGLGLTDSDCMRKCKNNPASSKSMQAPILAEKRLILTVQQPERPPEGHGASFAATPEASSCLCSRKAACHAPRTPGVWRSAPRKISCTVCAHIYMCIYIYTYIHTYIDVGIHTHIHVYVSLSIYLPIYLSTYLPIYLSTYLPIYLSTYLLIYLSICCMYTSMYLYIYLSLSLSRSPPDQVMMRAHYGARAHCGMTIRVPS